MRLKAEMLRWLAALLGTSAIVAMAILLAESAQSAPRAPVMIAAYSLGAGMILLLGTAFIRRRTWRQPLRRLGEAAARLGRGEWNIRVQPHGAPPVPGGGGCGTEACRMPTPVDAGTDAATTDDAG